LTGVPSPEAGLAGCVTVNVSPTKGGVMALIALILAAVTLALTGSPVHGADPAQLERNKKIVLEFYEKGLNQKDAEAASKYFGPKYVQHNPLAADGADGFRQFLQFLREKFPKSRSEIKRVFADGDFVILHVHSIREPGSRGAAVIDIFRLEDGKIVEHWDVIQPIPDKTANTNGMF
jgi:predicted SnoaL-like aldol condensation-catalyzing enzyme